MQERREELLRVAREIGLPVGQATSVTEIVHLLSREPGIAPDLCEALETILSAPLPASGN